MRKSNAAHSALLVFHVHARAAQDNVRVHTVDTNGRVVFDTQIDVFLDTESKVAVLEVEFVFTVK